MIRHVYTRLAFIGALATGLLLVACGESTATSTPAGFVTSRPAQAANTAAGLPATGLSTGTEKPSPFRIGLVPNQQPDTLKKQYDPFKAYMEKTLGIPIELFVASDYAGVVQAIASDKIDMAYFGGLTYVQAKQQADVYPIVTAIDRITHNRTYTSVIIVPGDSPVQKMVELKGKTFAFGDVSSTSGSLYPRIMLDQAGLKVPTDFKNVKYTGAHDATALAVSNSSVDAGGLEERILLRLEDQGKVDKTKVRVLQRSDPIMGYPWVVRAKLDKDFVRKVSDAFLTMTDPTLLNLLQAEGYAPVTDSDYQYIRDQATHFSLLTTQK